MHQYRLREQLEHGDQDRPWHLYRLKPFQGAVFPCHWHPEWELVVVKRGTLELTRDQAVVRLNSGDVAFLTGTELHGGTSNVVDSEVVAFVFHPELLRSERPDAVTGRWIDPLEVGSLGVPRILGAGTPPALVAHGLVQAVQEGRPGMELAVKGFLFQLLAEVISAGLICPGPAPSATDPGPGIRSVLQFLEEHFARGLTVESLARRANLSPSHFTRVFQAFTGTTPVQYLIRRRIDEADRLLRKGGLSVTQVALRVGFTNFSHFSKTFRAHRGVAPSEFAHPKAVV